MIRNFVINIPYIPHNIAVLLTCSAMMSWLIVCSPYPPLIRLLTTALSATLLLCTSTTFRNWCFSWREWGGQMSGYWGVISHQVTCRARPPKWTHGHQSEHTAIKVNTRPPKWTHGHQSEPREPTATKVNPRPPKWTHGHQSEHTATTVNTEHTLHSEHSD